jgi:outer membrane protein TolC
VLQLDAAARASAAAVDAAQSDLDRARNRRDVGLVTDADVLAVQVHLANMQQRQLATAGDLAVARVQLADAVGMPLDTAITLVTPSAAAIAPAADADALVRDARTARPESQAASLRVSLAENARRSAQAQFLPRVGAQAGWEFNGSAWDTQRSSWVVGAQVQLNLFRGFGDAARLAASRQAVARAGAEREQTDRRIEVDVRAALAQLAAARARAEAGRAAVMQARESQRIIRDRYDNGLAGITDVLRASEATLDAESRADAADTDVILQTVALDRALGRL